MNKEPKEEEVSRELICTVGLPRSGKTTWARQFSKDHGVPIVNPDSIRLAIHGHRFIADSEPFVWATAKAMTKSLFLAGHDVVILDAANHSRKRRDEWQSIHWKTVFHDLATPAEKCIQRAREMGDEEIVPVIARMADKKEPLGADETRYIPLGATGEFPERRYGEDDEGELRMAIAADKEFGVVRVDFGKPVTWLGLPHDHANALGEALITKARELH